MFSPCSPFCLLCRASSLPGLLGELALAWGCAASWGGAVGSTWACSLWVRISQQQTWHSTPVPLKTSGLHESALHLRPNCPVPRGLSPWSRGDTNAFVFHWLLSYNFFQIFGISLWGYNSRSCIQTLMAPGGSFQAKWLTPAVPMPVWASSRVSHAWGSFVAQPRAEVTVLNRSLTSA